MLEIKNLHVKLADEDRVILKGLSLEVPKGEVHAIMGPNGSGKSTLAYVLAGRDGYEVTEGDILWNGEIDPRYGARCACREGRLPGLPVSDGNSGRRGPDVSAHGAQCAEEKARRKGTDDAGLHEARQGEGQKLNIDVEMLKRPVNVGFSGGEKKRSEILQMALLEPTLCVLDETDSGLDIDALRIVAEGVNALRSKDRAFLVITHYQRLLNYIVPDKVHVLADGRIQKTGGKELALELEKSGYAGYSGKAA